MFFTKIKKPRLLTSAKNIKTQKHFVKEVKNKDILNKYVTIPISQIISRSPKISPQNVTIPLYGTTLFIIDLNIKFAVYRFNVY